MVTKHNVECHRRKDGSAWISVGDPANGPHFQCDFLGDVELGPVKVSDFAATPPPWVQRALNLENATKPGGGIMQHEDGYLIHKAGHGWYRPKAAGYTLNVDEAGRYTLAEALSHSHPNGLTGPRDGLSFRHESEVQPGSNCEDALRIHELKRERDALRKGQEEMALALAEATAQIESLKAELRGAEGAMDSFATMSDEHLHPESP